MTDIHDLERKIYRSLWEDGLLDLFVSVGLVLIGFTWLSDVAWMGGIVPVLLIPFWPLAKRSISAPRAGSFTPSRHRHAWEQRRLMALALAGVVTLGLGIVVYFYLTVRGSSGTNWLTVVIPGLPGVLVAIGMGGVGVAFGLHRFLAYAVALAATGVLAALGLFGPGWAFVLGGAAVLIWGGVVLGRFVSTHPVLPEDSP